MTEKELQRAMLDYDTRAFLERGGKITQLPENASAYADEPIRLTRRQQVEKMRGKRRKPIAKGR